VVQLTKLPLYAYFTLHFHLELRWEVLQWLAQLASGYLGVIGDVSTSTWLVAMGEWIQLAHSSSKSTQQWKEERVMEKQDTSLEFNKLMLDNLRKRELLLTLPNLRKKNFHLTQIWGYIFYTKESMIEDYLMIQYKGWRNLQITRSWGQLRFTKEGMIEDYLLNIYKKNKRRSFKH